MERDQRDDDEGARGRTESWNFVTQKKGGVSFDVSPLSRQVWIRILFSKTASLEAFSTSIPLTLLPSLFGNDWKPLPRLPFQPHRQRQNAKAFPHKAPAKAF